MRKYIIIAFFILPILSFPNSFNLKTGAYNRVESSQSYLILAFKPYFKYEKFYGSLDLEFAFDENGSLKQDDWDNTRAILEKIGFIGYGTYKDPFFFRIGILEEVNLGYGILVDRFRNDIYYPQRKKLGFDSKLDLGHGGAHVFVEDGFDMDMGGGRIFLRPLHSLNRLPKIAKGVQFGFSFVVDKDPLDKETDSSGDPLLSKDDDKSKVTQAFSVDFLIPFYKIKVFDISSYIEYGKLKNAGSALSYGFRGSFLSIFDYQAGVLYSWKGFIPGYFSAFYGVRDIRSTRFDEAKNAPDSFGYFLSIRGDFLNKQLKSGLVFNSSKKGGTSLQMYLLLQPTLFKRFFARFNYHRKEIAGVVESVDIVEKLSNTMILIELGYNITQNANISLRYIRSYKEENGVVSGNSVTEVQTNLFF